MDYYLYAYPDISLEQYQTKQMPVRNSLKLMTNTHLHEVDELRLIMVTEHNSSVNKLKTKKSSKFRGNRRRKAVPGNGEESDFAGKIDKHKINTEIFKLMDTTEIEDMGKSEIRRTDIVNTRKNGKQKRRDKKRRKYLKELAIFSVSKEGDVKPKVDLNENKNCNPKRNSTIIQRDNSNVICKDRTLYDDFTSEANEEFILEDLANSYYEDVGLSFKQIERQKSKIVRSAETIKEPENVLMIKKPENAQNAFYDQLTMKEDPKKRHKELMHRDSRGNLTLLSRSLPHLESDTYENSVEK